MFGIKQWNFRNDSYESNIMSQIIWYKINSLKFIWFDNYRIIKMCFVFCISVFAKHLFVLCFRKFSVGNSQSNYSLSVNGYSGTAGRILHKLISRD